MPAEVRRAGTAFRAILTRLRGRRMISPIRGDFTGFRVQVSDTLNPHSLLFPGMQECRPGLASGRGGLCFLFWPPFCSVFWVG
jgi:hypothetical protein